MLQLMVAVPAHARLQRALVVPERDGPATALLDRLARLSDQPAEQVFLVAVPTSGEERKQDGFVEACVVLGAQRQRNKPAHMRAASTSKRRGPQMWRRRSLTRLFRVVYYEAVLALTKGRGLASC